MNAWLRYTLLSLQLNENEVAMYWESDMKRYCGGSRNYRVLPQLSRSAWTCHFFPPVTRWPASRAQSAPLVQIWAAPLGTTSIVQIQMLARYTLQLISLSAPQLSCRYKSLRLHACNWSNAIIPSLQSICTTKYPAFVYARSKKKKKCTVHSYSIFKLTLKKWHLVDAFMSFSSWKIALHE